MLLGFSRGMRGGNGGRWCSELRPAQVTWITVGARGGYSSAGWLGCPVAHFSGKSDSVFRRHVVPPAIPLGTLPGTTEKLSKSSSLGTI